MVITMMLGFARCLSDFSGNAHMTTASGHHKTPMVSFRILVTVDRKAQALILVVS